jgi:cytochrome P450
LASTAPAPPSPRGRPFLGVLPHFGKHPAAYLLKAAREFGDIAHIRLGPLRAYLVSHPDSIRDILVTHQTKFTKSYTLQRAKLLLGEGLLTSEGEFHTRQRRLLQPAFHRERLRRYAADMTSCALKLRDQWTAGSERDIARDMMRLTLAIVGRTLFSADLSPDADEVGNAMSEILGLFGTVLMPFSDWLQKLPMPSVRRFENARGKLDAIIDRLIAERRNTGADTGDLLSMLLLAQDEETHARLTGKQVRDEALTLFIAGHEATANALTWTWYLLSQNPHAEQRMHEEIDRVLAGKPPEFEDLARLPYTTGVFAESLRLFPPAWGIGRRAKEDYEVGGHLIPARSIVLMSPWVVHRDPRWWTHPERFAPERWTAAPWQSGAPYPPGAPAQLQPGPQPGAPQPGFTQTSDATRPKFSYFPFGGGTRVCIGERFAWAEGVLVLAALAQRWKLKLVPGHPVETLPVITLRARYGMKMIVEPRRPCPDR